MMSYIADDTTLSRYVVKSIPGKSEEKVIDVPTLCHLLKNGGVMALQYDRRIVDSDVYAVDFIGNCFAQVSRPCHSIQKITIVCMHCENVVERHTLLNDDVYPRLLMCHLLLRRCNHNQRGIPRPNFFTLCEACENTNEEETAIWSPYYKNFNESSSVKIYYRSKLPFLCNGITEDLFHSSVLTYGLISVFHRCISKFIIGVHVDNGRASLFYCIPENGTRRRYWGVIYICCGQIRGQYTTTSILDTYTDLLMCYFMRHVNKCHCKEWIPV